MLDNDTRGWIMAVMSGLACILGASVICVDLLVQKIPGKKNFRIQDSNTFLSSSLSLSFGALLFSSLYSTLPSAKKMLERCHYSDKAANWMLISCFLAGVFGIHFLSRVLHAYIPCQVVNCDHQHDDGQRSTFRPLDSQPYICAVPRTVNALSDQGSRKATEALRGTTHLEEDNQCKAVVQGTDFTAGGLSFDVPTEHDHRVKPFKPQHRRWSLPSHVKSRVSNMVSGSKDSCDSDGECFGYSDPCKQDCFETFQARGRIRTSSYIIDSRTEEANEETPLRSHSVTYDTENNVIHNSPTSYGIASNQYSAEEAYGESHHHHVPTNAFLSIGLQTAIAIALHKLPEGFITYATNHANPRLGFSIFLALFIHNIAEGFAMALPLYLAIHSRWRAMFWSSVLGGASQPLGAAIAASWFAVVGNRNAEPGDGAYGILFAVTSGIMASVALQLFSESLNMTHDRNLCMLFAYVGMCIFGVSVALTA